MDVSSFNAQADKISSALSSTSTTMSQIGTYAMQRGLTALQNDDTDQAIKSFRMAIGMDPTNSDAYSYLGNTFLQKGDTKHAIEAFKMMTRVNPSDPNGYNSLGNAYLQAKDYSNAEAQLKMAIRVSPSSNTPYYTLGLMYAQQGRNQEAEQQFAAVQRLTPNDAHGYYGMGLAYNNEGRYDEAITQLEKAASMKDNFAEAVFQLGKAYAANGQIDEAKDQITALKNMPASTNGVALGVDLQDSITKPKMTGIDLSTTTFLTFFGMNTPLYMLNGSLIQANASKDFTMVFQFDSAMDPGSVQDLTKWSISKGSNLPGGLYNNGITMGKDTPVPPMPKSVSYDSTTQEATITFTLTQNSSGNGTIDPSHLIFKFSGTDINGKQMDDDANQYAGFKGGIY